MRKALGYWFRFRGTVCRCLCLSAGGDGRAAASLHLHKHGLPTRPYYPTIYVWLTRLCGGSGHWLRAATAVAKWSKTVYTSSCNYPRCRANWLLKSIAVHIKHISKYLTYNFSFINEFILRCLCNSAGGALYFPSAAICSLGRHRVGFLTGFLGRGQPSMERLQF